MRLQQISSIRCLDRTLVGFCNDCADWRPEKKTSSQSWQDLRRDHGSPVSRQRIFIILVKSDLMENDCKDKLGDIFLEIKALLACTADVGWLLGWSLLRCLSKQNLEF